MLLTRAAKERLPRILDWMKCAGVGFVVTGLRPVRAQPTIDPFFKRHDAKEIGSLIQRIRKRHGVGAVGLGLAGLKSEPRWERKREMVFERYTAHWDEVLVVKSS